MARPRKVRRIRRCANYMCGVEFAHRDERQIYCSRDCWQSRNGYTIQDKPLNAVWRAMLARCTNPATIAWPWYGGRGITVCLGWFDYARFESWALSHGYKHGLSIDRIDNNGNYEPGNCRWVTRDVQSANTSQCKRLTAFGETKTMGQWERDHRCTVTRGAVAFRMKQLGYGPEQAITTPFIPHTQRNWGKSKHSR